MRLEKSYEPAAVEARWYADWESHGYFRPEAVPDATGDPFVIVIPPPNVTGSLHMGHALNNTLQDILVRYHRMNRRPTLWLPGTDHAGIATQVVVERQLKGGAAERRAMGREAFIGKVWEWRKVSGSTILQQLRRLGVSCDWSRERFTLDEGLTRAVREVFVALYEQGLIYRGDRLINWCVSCGTALSDLEVEYKDQQGALYFIKYGDLEVATTRPETKVGDTALAVHPDDARYRHLVGTTLTIETELGPIQLPVIADDVVDPTFGSGIVKVTPAHDQADFDMGQRHQLAVKRVIGEDGRMTAEAGKYAGMERSACRAQIVEDLRALGLLIKEEPYKNRVGGCQRCGTVVEPLISRQWFVKIEPLATPALQAVRDGRTRFVPKHWENTYYAWMENIRDWCISRQLWWGHRIPAWTCVACNELVVAREDPSACPKCGGALSQESDVLDTWFSSALWPFSTHGWPEQTDDVRRYYPSTVLVTGFDIIFFWVARMMMLGLRFMGEVPFKDVVIHGLVRDASGAKMSKSKGNVVDPLGLLDEFGTDATRFALTACVGMGRDLRLDQQRITGYRNFTNKLWNAARFLLMNLEGAGPLVAETAAQLARGERPADLTLPDRWILSRLERAVTAVRTAVESYNFAEAADQLYRFAWHELCDWYLEAAKGPLYGGGEAAERTRGVLVHAVERLMRLLHPVMPFITEEIWQAVTTEVWGDGRGERFAPSIMIDHYPAPLPALLDPAAEQEMERVIALVRAVRNIRSEFNVPPARNLVVDVAAQDPTVRASIEAAASLVRSLARIDPLTLRAADELPKAAAVESVDGMEIAVPLAQLVDDVGSEISRLERELAKAAQDGKVFSAKLSNPQFADKAPPDVVAEVREKAAALEEKQRTLTRSLERLRALGTSA